MTATQGDLAGLSRLIFRVPAWYASVAVALAVAAVTGTLVFESTYLFEAAWEGLFFLGIPTVAATLLSTALDRRLGGRLTRDRSALLALVCEFIVIAVLLVAGTVAMATSFGQQFVFDALLIALAAIFAFRLLILMAVSRLSTARTVVTASLQTVAAAVMLFVYSGTLYYIQLGGPLLETVFARPSRAPEALQYSVYPFDFVLLAVICGIHAGAVYFFLQVIDEPWQRSLGVSVLDFIQGFIGHLGEGSNDLEEFFEEIGEEALVPVTVLSFRRPDGDEKAAFVLPMIHPGPMGDIGGGNLPIRVAEETEGLAFPAHATAGHDFNLVTSGEVETICETAANAYDRIEYGETATQGARVREGDATLTGHAFGEDALVVNTFAPTHADDVEYAVGLSAVSEARSGGLEDVLLVDAHNCNDGLEGEDLGHIVPGSERSFDLIHGAGRLAERLSGMKQHPLKLGTAWEQTDWEPEDGVGPLGIRVAVLEAGGHTTAYVLVDGNNMEPGLRDYIVGQVDAVDAVEVMTSDTHIVNTVEAENQVGQAIPDEDLLAVIEDLVGRAVADLEPVEAGMASERAEVTVFGNDRTETLASHANAMVSMGFAMAGVFILAVVSVSVLLFLAVNLA
jgi:putative membrane protein